MVSARQNARARAPVDARAPRWAIVRASCCGKTAITARDEDVTLGAPISEAKAIVGWIGIGYVEPPIDRAHAQKALPSTTAPAGLTRTIPIEGDSEGAFAIARSVARYRCAISTERRQCVSGVKCVAEWRQITDLSKRNRGTTNPVEVSLGRQRPFTLGLHVVVAVSVNALRSEGILGARWRGCGSRSCCRCRWHGTYGGSWLLQGDLGLFRRGNARLRWLGAAANDDERQGPETPRERNGPCPYCGQFVSGPKLKTL